MSSIAVGISDYKLSRSPDTLVTYALGSCVGIALYDPSTGMGGLSHIMLPSSSMNVKGIVDNSMKYADTAIPELVSEMERNGAIRKSIVAKLVGGANMFNVQGTSFVETIGSRNVAAARNELERLGIPLIAEDVGANYGRTVYFQLEDGKIRVQSLSKNINMI